MEDRREEDEKKEEGESRIPADNPSGRFIMSFCSTREQERGLAERRVGGESRVAKSLVGRRGDDKGFITRLVSLTSTIN